MSISAALVVRDEAHHLHDCIQSLVGQVDEIILLDTGSTDGTLNLEWLGMLSAPITLATFAWCDDFSAARNEALGYCQADWVLIVDADDRLQGDLRGLVDDAPDDVLAYAVNTVSHWPDGQATLSADHCRLWRNGHGIHYRRRVHELPYMPDGSDVPMTHQDDVRLLHTGYDVSGYARLAKRERNRRLVMLGLAEEPENPRYLFDAARAELGAGHVAAAQAYSLHSLHAWADQGCQPREFVGHCLDLALQLAMNLGDDAAGEACFDLVPAEFRTLRASQLFGRLLVG